jgi:hypothetical protein
VKSSVVDRHRVDDDPDQDPTFHFDADPDPTPSLTHTRIGQSEFFYTFIHINDSLHCFIFLVSVVDVIDVMGSFQYVEQYIEIFWEGSGSTTLLFPLQIKIYNILSSAIVRE